jgi:hypothetical protein
MRRSRVWALALVVWLMVLAKPGAAALIAAPAVAAD